MVFTWLSQPQKDNTLYLNPCVYLKQIELTDEQLTPGRSWWTTKTDPYLPCFNSSHTDRQTDKRQELK